MSTHLNTRRQSNINTSHSLQLVSRMRRAAGSRCNLLRDLGITATIGADPDAESGCC